MVIGFIDNLSDISDQVLIKHLQEVKGLSRARCYDNIKYFWEITLNYINDAPNRGI